MKSQIKTNKGKTRNTLLTPPSCRKFHRGVIQKLNNKNIRSICTERLN